MSYGQSNTYLIANPYPTVFGPQAVGWIIGAIRVDNYSDYWWSIAGTDFAVPPHTLGWSREIRPAQTQFSLVQGPVIPTVASVTDTVFVKAYEFNGTDPTYGDSDGTAFDLIPTLGALVAAINALGVKLDTVNTNLGTLDTDILATNAALATLDTDVLALGTKIDLTNTRLSTLNTTLGVTNTNLGILGAATIPSYQIVAGTIAPNAGLTQVVAATAGQTIFVVSWKIAVSGPAIGGSYISGEWSAEMYSNATRRDFASANSKKPYISEIYFPYGIPMTLSQNCQLQTFTQDASNPPLVYQVRYYKV